MARDKLITIRIEGEKRKAFGDLAKSQNTDTASLLYDFINQCLSGTLDISLVTGKGNRLDKIDNQLDTNRLDKIDNQLDTIAKKLADYVEAFDSRLNALSMQLDSQRIDTDSQKDRQGEPLIKEALRLDHLDDQRLIDAIESQLEESTEIDKSDYESVTSPLPNQETVETADAVETDSIDEPGTDAIKPVPGDTVSIESVTGEGTVSNRQGLTNDQLSKKIGIPTSTIEKWKGKIREGKEITSTKYPKFFKQWTLNLADSLWYEV